MRIGSVFFVAAALFVAGSCKREPEKYQVRYEWRQGTVVEKWEAGVRAPDGTVETAEFAKLKVWGEEESEVVIDGIYYNGTRAHMGECRRFYAEIHERGNQREIRPALRNLEFCYRRNSWGGFGLGL